jgi:hypothetical protein
MRSAGRFGSDVGMFADVNTKRVDIENLETPDLPGAYDNIRFPVNGLGNANAAAIIGMNGVQSFGITGWTSEKDLDDRLRRYADYLRQRIKWINETLPIRMRQQIARELPIDPENPIETRPHPVAQAQALLAHRGAGGPGSSWYADGGGSRRINRLEDVKEGYERLENYLQSSIAPLGYSVPMREQAPFLLEQVIQASVPDFDFLSAPSSVQTIVAAGEDRIVEVKADVPWGAIMAGAAALVGLAFWLGGKKG